MNFEKAKKEDINKIISISTSYFNHIQPDGFLVKNLNESIVLDFINNSKKEIYVARNSEQVILGYVMIDAIIHYDKNENKFINEEDRKLLHDENTKYVYQVAINKEFKKMKVGSFLYENIFKMYRDTTFLLSVVTKPVKNEASYSFHRKNGFEVIAYFNKDEYRGIKGYESVLFKRSLSK